MSEAARLASAPAADRGIQIRVDLDPKLEPVEMAPQALLQVFRNLTTNAIQATASGGTLRLTTLPDPGTQGVVATVADSGPGLSSETLGHLFEPFFTTKPEGTGLGLAIAREIALAHRGELHAANRSDGPGAIFTLRLPVASSRIDGESS